jgi:signal transduction histidine kinase
MGNRSSRPAEAADTVASTMLSEAQQESDPSISISEDCSQKCQVASVSAPSSESAEVDENGAYEEALIRCADLRRQRQKLLRAKAEVRAIIAQYIPRFEETYDSETASDEDENFEDSNSDSESLEDMDEKSISEQKEMIRDSRSYEEVLAEQQELEDEVEGLREMLSKASEMIASVAKQSLELSEHLEEVEAQTALPSGQSSLVAPTSGTSSEDGSTAAMCNEVFEFPICFTLSKPGSLAKLPSLRLVGVPGKGGSEASSSTATPRSEKSSESRIASARSEKGESCWCEA